MSIQLSKLGTQLFLSVFLPISTLIGVNLSIFYQIQSSAISEEIAETERELVADKRKELSDRLNGIAADLLVLSQEGELQRMLDPNSDRAIVEMMEEELAEEYLVFAEEKKVYDRIIALDLQGEERVRINAHQDEWIIVSDDSLNNQSDRDWFHQILKLDEDDVFMSSLMLKIGVSESEDTPQPIIRLGTTIVDASDRPQGILVVTYLADDFLQELTANLSYSESMWLLDEQGYWLKGDRPQDEWGFSYNDERQNRTLAKQSPQTWEQISRTETGQLKTEEGLYTFATIYPLQDFQDGDSYEWKLVAHMPIDLLHSAPAKIRNQLLILFVILTGLTALGSALFAQAKLKNQYSDRRVQGLQDILEELHRNQAHLVQTEKMASLGQLVAGVAHEINNPVNFIRGNLIHSQTYIQDMVGLLALYQQHYPEAHPDIQERIESIDLEFIQEDASELFHSMNIGVDRITEIVKSLRIFSRLDESEIKEVNLHEGIDSTLTILHTRLRASDWRPAIQVVKNYGMLPRISCCAGQLNQVFMNILSNAIDALEERDRDRSFAQMEASPSAITIETNVQKNWIIIQISDNGLGISPEAQLRLFDPFFTTKPVGKGTGLGLAISYQVIVEKHKGTLSCSSEPGMTTFTIEIPLKSGNEP